MIIEIPEQRIDRKNDKLSLSLSRINEQPGTQITSFNTSHGQNSKYFLQVLKCSASKKKPKNIIVSKSVINLVCCYINKVTK